ncbi:MAG: ABC-F family ATP-binding cassette domain-containing protein [Bacteriovoracaceae bacterium]|nr:ABC-F family ATP-binding cassette domain-containing protein [Bacteriovoracaceae bacterium]
MGILCNLTNINLAFGEKIIFKNANLTIRKGDKIGLLGLNGKGKSSLFKILCEEVTPDISVPSFNFSKAKGLDDETLRFSIFYIPQELPLDENLNPTVLDYIFHFYPILGQIQTELETINTQLENNNTPNDTTRLIEKQKNLLEQFEHLDGWNTISSYQSYLKHFGNYDLTKFVKDLSGGEQKKILLSLGLSSKANVVLWDEPTNHLDIESIKLFEDELESSNSTFIIVTHDRYLLSKLTNKICHILNGEIAKFEGTYPDYLEFLSEKEEERKRVLERLKNGLRRETAWMRQGIKARGCRSKKRVEGFHALAGSVAELKASAKKTLELSIVSSDRKTKELIGLKNVGFEFPDKLLFKELNLSIAKGNKIGLVGPNGVGKTTLINLVAGNLAATSGTVKRADDLIIQHFSQKREELDLSSTPYELLGEGEDYVHLPGGRSVHVITYFESFLFDRNEVKRPISTMSGGEKNRLQMALNLKRPGDLWIFDEPTNDLDLETLQILEQKLGEFEGSVIIISHDRTFLSTVTNKVWLITNNSIENFEGGYAQAESYLEAVALENLLNLSECDTTPTQSKENETVTEVKTSSKKLSNKEKQRIKALPREIEQLEIELLELEEVIEDFDFANHTSDRQKQYEGLSIKRNAVEEKLLHCYEEKESIEEKL